MKILVPDPISESGMSFSIEACRNINRWVIPCEIKVTVEMIEYAEKLQVIGYA